MTDQSFTTDSIPVTDGIQNLQARIGTDAGSMADATTYVLANPITRRPRDLEYMYRQSWIVGVAVDSVADDMTRAGVDFGSALSPQIVENMVGVIEDLQLWNAIGDVIRWARLYGGAIGVLLIDGQDLETPLRNETVGKGQFRGILPLSRWELLPAGVGLSDPQIAITDLGPNIGQQKMYAVGPNASALVNKRIHYSRIIRSEGTKLPFFQRMAEQGWGISIVERMFDRLTAYDSATTGAAQLVFKAYLRVLKVQGLRKILAAGGAAEEALAKNVEAIRKFQSTEGLTLIDSEDEFETYNYTFSGLDSLLIQFGEQISGATEIPLVRLLGQSPGGLNSTGESDLRNYYDSINAKQNRTLRSPMTRILDILHRSVTGVAPPQDFNYKFNPLWQLSETEKATASTAITTAVATAFTDGIITKSTALKELKQSADVTGIFSNIEDTEIEAADAEPPPMSEVLPPEIPMLLGAPPPKPVLGAPDLKLVPPMAAE